MLPRWAVVAAVSTFLAGAAAAQSLDEIVARNLAARGGVARIKAVKSMRWTARMTIAPGLEAPAILEMKRPGRMRLDLSLPDGATATQVIDGAGGWQIPPGADAAMPLSAEDARSAAERADLDGPLVDYTLKGHRLELLGRDTADGVAAFKLRLTLKNGSVQTMYIDAVSYLEIKDESTRTLRGAEILTEQRIGDYRDVGGLKLPHRFENGIQGRPDRQKVTIEKIELDVAIDDARFAMPGA
jgi:outer membrane lipoprotein-sorting protein